jgi:NitT/TauT family transport system permease protein
MPSLDVDAGHDAGGVVTDEPGSPGDRRLRTELSGLDRLELGGDGPRQSTGRRIWRLTWPKVAAVALGLGIWQLAVWLEWKPEYALASPGDAFSSLWELVREGTLWTALDITLRRALGGFAVALVIGIVIGTLVAGIEPVRIAVGSLITGLQTMPSIAWFPLAILLFGRNEHAITFVVVLGAAPSIANGVIAGVDNIPPLLLRAGRVLDAKGLALYRHVIVPAALPGFMAGLKQGWAFAWRSLMAGELLVIIANRPSLGVRLQFARELSDAEGLLAAMLVVLIIGVVVDSLVFGRLEHIIRERRGLIDPAG